MQFGEDKYASLRIEKRKTAKSQNDFHQWLNHQTNERGR